MSMDLSPTQKLRNKACTWLIKLTLVMSVFAGPEFSAISNQQQHQRAQTEISIAEHGYKRHSISIIYNCNQTEYYFDIQIINHEHVLVHYNISILVQIQQYSKNSDSRIQPPSLPSFHYARQTTEDFNS